MADNGNNGDGNIKVVFTEDQQKLVDKLIGDARVKSREKAKADHDAQTSKDKDAAEQAALVAQKEWQKLAEKHEARVKELEPLEAKAKAYEVLVEGQLKEAIKELGDGAKTLVASLPDSMSAIEKLIVLNKNRGSFGSTGAGVGTPAGKKPLKKKGAADVGHQRMRM